MLQLREIPSRLTGLFTRRPPALQSWTPKAASHVPGFSISVTRKNGCVLRSRPKDSPEGTPYTDSGVDEHFEVVTTYDGTNSQYGNSVGPQTRLFTSSLSRESGYGFVGAVNYIRPRETFLRFDIIEEYEDWKNAEISGSRWPKPEYVVWLKMTWRTFDGHKLYSKMGITARPAK